MTLIKARSPRVLVLAALGASGLACQPQPTTTQQSGALAISADGTRLYVADADNNQLLIVDPSTRTVAKTVAVGKEPTRVVVAADGRVFVSNSQDRSVSVIDPKTGAETKRIAVGTEPTGMAFTADGKTLLVANRTNATVSVVDVPSLAVRSTIPTEADPSGVAVLPDGRVYVTHVRSGNVSILDKQTFTVSGSFPMTVPLSTAIVSQPRQPEQPITPVVTFNGHVLIPHSESDVSLIDTTTPDVPTPDKGGGGAAYAGGSDGFNFRPPVVAPAIATIDPNTNTVLAGTETGAADVKAGDAIVPATILTSNGSALAGPSAAVIDPGGKFLYVVHLNSNNVAIIPLTMSEPTNSSSGPIPPQEATKRAALPGGSNVMQLISVGAGPTGIALPREGGKGYVYNSFDHTISVIARTGNGDEVKQTDVFRVGTTSLTPEQDLGRRLFFSAADTRMTSTAAGGVACASCHPGGREDGRTWQFTEGPRNTPTLAGRHLGTTAPYHWDGALATMHDFNAVITKRMGGAGDGSSNIASLDGSALTDTDFNAMLSFLDGQAAPDNPFRDAAKPEAVANGKALFEGKANCASCHNASSNFTDNGFHSVGTVGLSETFAGGLVNTPTLHNLFATAPYLHDGSKATLRDRVRDDANGQHGHTSDLTPAEVDDLVTYLQTL
jgi:YVTN family beta-propeller protein